MFSPNDDSGILRIESSILVLSYANVLYLELLNKGTNHTVIIYRKKHLLMIKPQYYYTCLGPHATLAGLTTSNYIYEINHFLMIYVINHFFIIRPWLSYTCLKPTNDTDRLAEWKHYISIISLLLNTDFLILASTFNVITNFEIVKLTESEDPYKLYKGRLKGHSEATYHINHEGVWLKWTCM